MPGSNTRGNGEYYEACKETQRERLNSWGGIFGDKL
jgi:hypothetical protein